MGGAAGGEQAQADAGDGGEHRRPGHGEPRGEVACPEFRDPATGANAIVFPCGACDGSYPLRIGRDHDGKVTCLIADMLTMGSRRPLPPTEESPAVVLTSPAPQAEDPIRRRPPRRLRRQPSSSPNCSPGPPRWRDGRCPARARECPAGSHGSMAGSRQGRPRPGRRTPRLRRAPEARPGPRRRPQPGMPRCPPRRAGCPASIAVGLESDGSPRPIRGAVPRPLTGSQRLSPSS